MQKRRIRPTLLAVSIYEGIGCLCNLWQTLTVLILNTVIPCASALVASDVAKVNKGVGFRPVAVTAVGDVVLVFKSRILLNVQVRRVPCQRSRHHLVLGGWIDQLEL
jgi:hypothetical protein